MQMKAKLQVNYGMKQIHQHEVKDVKIMYKIIAAQGKRSSQSPRIHALNVTHNIELCLTR